MDKNQLDILIKLGFTDQGDVFKRKIFGNMATIIAHFIYENNILKKIKVSAESEWSEFSVKDCNFNQFLEYYDEMVYHYETQYSQYIHDLKRGRYSSDSSIKPDKILKSSDI